MFQESAKYFLNDENIIKDVFVKASKQEIFRLCGYKLESDSKFGNIYYHFQKDIICSGKWKTLFVS